jgi:serine/threonine protein kinase
MDFEKIGKYKILGELGSGAMGVVYRAHDPILDRHVAIKMISSTLGVDDELRKRFHREAQAAARLNHPNIITVFDFGEEQGRMYIAMELLEGSDLKDIMAAGTLQTLDDKLAIMEQILDGLAFAHAKEITHRDLKPGNIHIQPNGQIKIVDFGLARLGSSEMTQAGVVMGTPNYMSPEQVLGEKVDVRSDVFAMGAVFYELLSNHKPFEAESMHGVLFQVVHKEPQDIRKWVPDLSPVLIQMLAKCLIKDKSKRFANAGEMRDAITIVRQALAAGRINEATLDMESGQVFFDAEEYVEEGQEPRAMPSLPPVGSETWVEGTVALDRAPLEGVLEAPPGQPTLSGRNRTQQPAYGPPSSLPPTGPSRAPLYIGGAILVAAVIIGGILILKGGPAAPTGPDPVVELLVETRNELAQAALDNKDYKKAIDAAEQTVSVAKSKNFPADHTGLVQAEKILAEARSKFTAIETTASEAEDAFNAQDAATASEKLRRLLELDPNHPVAKDLTPKLNDYFQEQVKETRGLMEQARQQAESVSSAAAAEYRSEGRADMGRAGEAVTAAEASLRSREYAQATQKFLEARDAYDRARRAIETKMAEAAKEDAVKAAAMQEQFKNLADVARSNMGTARTAAEQAGAATNPAAKGDFDAGAAAARDAEAAMARQDFVNAKKSYDDARISFSRARQAIEAVAQARGQAEAARTATGSARQRAEGAGVSGLPEFARATGMARDAEAAMGRSDFAGAKGLFDQARAQYEQAIKAGPPVTTQAPATTLAPTAAPTIAPTLAPPTAAPTVAPPARGPVVGALAGNPADRSDATSKKTFEQGLGGAPTSGFLGTMDFEVTPPDIAVGDHFSIKVWVTNTGSREMRFRGIDATPRVNRAPGRKLPASLKVRDLAPGQRAMVAEITGTWEAADSWVLTVVLDADKDVITNRVAFRKQ